MQWISVAGSSSARNMQHIAGLAGQGQLVGGVGGWLTGDSNGDGRWMTAVAGRADSGSVGDT